MAVAKKTMHECVEVLLKRLLSPLTFFLALQPCQERERERDAGITWQAGLETNTHGICVFFSHCCFACKMVVFWCFDIDFNKLPLDKISNMTYISIYCVSFQLP